MEFRLLCISVISIQISTMMMILLGQQVAVCGAFVFGGWTQTRSGIPTTRFLSTKPSPPSPRSVLFQHVRSQTYQQDVQAEHDFVAVTDVIRAVEADPVETATVRTSTATVPTTVTATVTTTTLNNNMNNRACWMDRVQQLHDYSCVHGTTLVPKRYKANPPLGNWVNKQRQVYRKFLRKEQPCALTQQHVDILNSLGFCWDASNVTHTVTTTTATASTVTTPRHQTSSSSSPLFTKVDTPESDANTDATDHVWWTRLKEFEHYMACLNNTSSTNDNMTTPLMNANLPRGESTSPPPTHIRAWIRQQRRNFKMNPNRLSQPQYEALNAIDPNWSVSRRQFQWNVQFQQLRIYKQQHGDCIVPISHANKQLANWVHNQRKQYNLRLKGKASDLTTERLQRLQDIGFVWNRWEYEFTKKQVQTGYATVPKKRVT
jgi:hypothetical protein